MPRRSWGKRGNSATQQYHLDIFILMADTAVFLLQE